jgi:transcriptional regulator with XRE-family HTH domain
MTHPTKSGKPYDHAALADYLDGLRQAHNESFRQAALRSGLDHGAFLRYIRKHQRPTRESCIAMADHFGVNPNEILTRAGYDPLHFFDRSLVDPQALAPEVEEIAVYLNRLSPLARRREVCQAVRALVDAAARTARDP